VAERYRILHELGRGGMGVVYAAEHLQLPQRVAIKVMLQATNVEARLRFQREAELASQLRSPHVGRVFDVAALPSGEPLMIMELLEGSDLDQLLASQGPLPVALAIDYVLQACDALAEAHALGAVHRDLKPSNLFLAKGHDGRAAIKVLDFGIAKAKSGPGPSLTQTGAAIGTPYYMAPEQLVGARDVDARADVWALGATLYQLLTGRLPFEGTTLAEVHVAILKNEPYELRAHRPDLPPAVDAAVMACLRKEPDHRCPSVASLAAALAPYASSSAQATAARLTGVAVAAPPAGIDAHAPTLVAPTPVGPTPVGPTPVEPTFLGPTLGSTSMPHLVAASPQPTSSRPKVVALVMGLAAFAALAIVIVVLAARTTSEASPSAAEPGPTAVASWSGPSHLASCPQCRPDDACRKDVKLDRDEPVDLGARLVVATEMARSLEPSAQLRAIIVEDWAKTSPSAAHSLLVFQFVYGHADGRLNIVNAHFTDHCAFATRGTTAGKPKPRLAPPACPIEKARAAVRRAAGVDAASSLNGAYRLVKGKPFWVISLDKAWLVDQRCQVRNRP
jgi:eukaryotic-like serine/threonine-protein kinase